MQRLALVLALATACGGGKPTLVLDADVVTERLDRIEADVPSCHKVAVADPMMRASARKLGEVLDAMRLLGGPNANFAGVSSSGTCGGSLDVTFEHESGITDYIAAMNGFCVSGAEGDTTYDGTIVAKEVGKPTDAGPLIQSLELSTDGAITMVQGDDTVEITIEDVKTKYGVPGEFAPHFPEEGSPDVTSVGAVRLVFPDGREDYVQDVQIERVGGIPAYITILGGTSGTVGEDHSVLRTPADDPLQVNVYDGVVLGGTLELVGAKDTVVTVSPRPGSPGVYDLTLNGEAFDEAIDCSSGEAPKSTTVDALLQALPVY